MSLVGGIRDWTDHKLNEIGGLRQLESNSSRGQLRRPTSGRQWGPQMGWQGQDEARAVSRPSPRRCMRLQFLAWLLDWVSGVYTRWTFKVSILHTLI